jgi:hypothetical protein
MSFSFSMFLEFVEDTDHDDVAVSKESDVMSPHPRSEVPDSFDAHHVHINPTDYNQNNVPGSPGESISAFPLATAPPLEETSQTSTNHLPSEQGTAQTTSNQPLEEPVQGHTINLGTFPHTVPTLPGQITPEQSTHVETIPSQTTSQESVPEKSTPVLGTPEISTPVLSTSVEYPSISATPLEHSKTGETIVTIPSLEASSNHIKAGSVLIKLPSKHLHLDSKGIKINSTLVNGTVLKINGSLYLVKGSLTKLPKTKSAHANKLVGSLVAGVALKDSNEHLVNGTKAGVTTDGDGDMFSYDGTSLTTLEDKPFDAHVIKVKVKSEEQKNPPKKKLAGMS